MASTLSNPRLRRLLPWTAPVAVGAVIAGITVLPSAAFGTAHAKLPAKTAGALLAGIQASSVQALSGTIVETARFGLPQLPTGGSSSLSIESLITGSNTARVWIDGPERQRLALLGTLSESDVVHNGKDLWSYTSDTMAVTHKILSSKDTKDTGVNLDPGQYVPRTAAADALKAIDPTTLVSVDRTSVVAGRSAYTLVLRPRDSRSSVSRILIAVDGATSVPLRVQVYGSAAAPAFETGFTDVSFAKPAASVFAFTPPAGATVTNASPLSLAETPRRFGHGETPAAPGISPLRVIKSAGGKADSSMRVIGKGWTAVLELGSAPGSQIGILDQLTTRQPDGSKLLHSTLFNGLILPDGRVFIGAVTQDFLQHVAATTTS